jgi:hypothetical protein
LFVPSFFAVLQSFEESRKNKKKPVATEAVAAVPTGAKDA